MPGVWSQHEPEISDRLEYGPDVDSTEIGTANRESAGEMDRYSGGAAGRRLPAGYLEENALAGAQTSRWRCSDHVRLGVEEGRIGGILAPADQARGSETMRFRSRVGRVQSPE